METMDHILLVEDDAHYAQLMQIGLEEAGVPNPVHVVSCGREAIQYLAGEGPFSDRALYPEPALVLLDIELPQQGGFEVLLWIRNQPRYRELPVVMLSGLEVEWQVRQAQEFGATAYRVKPFAFNDLRNLVREISDRWLRATAGAGHDA
jgi:CheY-like chemotaxis protein